MKRLPSLSRLWRLRNKGSVRTHDVPVYPFARMQSSTNHTHTHSKMAEVLYFTSDADAHLPALSSCKIAFLVEHSMHWSSRNRRIEEVLSTPMQILARFRFRKNLLTRHRLQIAA